MTDNLRHPLLQKTIIDIDIRDSGRGRSQSDPGLKYVDTNNQRESRLSTPGNQWEASFFDEDPDEDQSERSTLNRDASEEIRYEMTRMREFLQAILRLHTNSLLYTGCDAVQLMDAPRLHNFIDSSHFDPESKGLKIVTIDPQLGISDKFVRTKDIASFFLNFDSESAALTWIHVLCPSVLPVLVSNFDMHPLVLKTFTDNRAHAVSNILGGNSLMMSALSPYMEQRNLHSHKLTMHATQKVLITFEQELMTPSEYTRFSQERIFVAVCRCLPEYRTLIDKHGVPMLMNMCLLELLDTAMPVLDFYSYANQIMHHEVHKPYNETNSSKMARLQSQLHAMLAGLVLLEAHFKTWPAQLCFTHGSGHKLEKFMRTNVIREHDIPYFEDLADSVQFVLDTIKRNRQAVNDLRETLVQLYEAQTQQTNTILSLIATLFLPATFLTGMFGMNFTYKGGHGAYAPGIGILNSKDGPYVFYGLCGIFFCTTLLYFKWRGWTSAFLPNSDVNLLPAEPEGRGHMRAD